MATNWQSLIAVFNSKRADFLREALAAVKNCCPSPGTLFRNQQNDQDWLELLSSEAHHVHFADAYVFFKDWKLRLFWNFAKVSSQIMKWRAAYPSVGHQEVQYLVDALRNCRTLTTPYTPTSAASKVAFFAKPGDEVYIWDSMAIRSARFRDWRRTGGLTEPQAFKREYTTSSGNHDYPSFAAACKKALADEVKCSDFITSLNKFGHFLHKVGGPMNNYPSLIKRRFLDKLMWAEGAWLTDQDL